MQTPRFAQISALFFSEFPLNVAKPVVAVVVGVVSLVAVVAATVIAPVCCCI